jgi:sugar/nucleoside kinase (ribokinase family)
MPHIFGAGLVALDLIVEHRPTGRALSASGGGTCGNVLAILAHMGWKASWVGAVDGSVAGHLIRNEMNRVGVDLSMVAECASSPAPVFAHHVHWSSSDEMMHHCFATECPHCSQALPRYSRPADTWLLSHTDKIEHADIFFVDRLSTGALELAATARKHGALVVYEPSVTSDSPWLEEMLAIADVVKYSHDRVTALGDMWGRPTNHRALWIETRGKDGLRWAHSDQRERNGILPAVHNPLALDACGAGDWFTCALLFGFTQSKMKPVDLGEGLLIEILKAASRLAAWSCGFVGARGGLYESSSNAIFEHLQTFPSRPTQSRSPLTRPQGLDACRLCPTASTQMASP